MGNATLRSISDFNSSKILDINLYIIDSNIIAQSSVTLGNDFEWQNSTFESNSAYATINAEKLSNGLIRFSFGGSQ